MGCPQQSPVLPFLETGLFFYIRHSFSFQVITFPKMIRENTLFSIIPSRYGSLLPALLTLVFCGWLSAPGVVLSQGGGSQTQKCSFEGEVSLPDSLSLYSDKDPRVGPPGAPVRIAEFYDPGCPYCRKLHVQEMPKVMDEVPSDSVSFYYRPFPLRESSIPLFFALYYADDQGVFSDLLDVMYSFGKPTTMSRTVMETYAKSVDLDPGPFFDKVSSGDYLKHVRSSRAVAKQIGVRGTPTLIINGKKVSRGGYNADCLSNLINQEIYSSKGDASEGSTEASEE